MADIGLVDAENPVLKQIDDAAMRYGVDRNLAHAVAQIESSYNPNAVSPVGAQGVMQLMPATANSLGVRHAFDSAQNIDGGVRLLGSLLRKYGGDTRLVLAAYNAGEPAVDRAGGNVPNFPETQNYVKKGLSILNPRPAAPSAAAPDIGLEDAPAQPAQPPAAPAKPSETERLAGIAAGSSGLGLMSDISGGFRSLMDRMVGNTPLMAPPTPQERKAGTAIGGVAQGIAAEPERMRQQLIKSGDAMLHGDPIAAAKHIAFAIPFAGAAGAQMQEYLDRGDVSGALAHGAGAIAPFAAGPAAEAGTEAAATAGRAAGETAATIGRGVRAAAPDVAQGTLKAGLGAGAASFVPGPMKYIIGSELTRPGLRQIVTGLKAGVAAAREVPAIAAELPVPPEVGITPEVLPPLQLGPGPIITPPPPDPSFVRAVPAEYPYVEHPLVRAAQQAGDLTPQEQALADHILQNVEPTKPPATPPVAPAAPQAAPAAPEAPAATQEPSAAPSVPEAPQTLQPAAAVEKLTDYVLGKKIAPHMIDRLPAEYWQMIADEAGTAVPTADEIAQIKANVAAKAVETPVQGEQVFETQKARIEEGMTPPKETPQEPPNYPPHYEYIRQADSKMAAERAFLKDQRVADYLLGKGITPEEFLAKTLEEQNKLILEAPAKSAKGKHLPFLPKPEGAAPRAVGRYAEEGIKDIANTMRWRQAQTPAAPEAAAISTEGLENTPIAGKAGFEAEKAKPAPAKRTRRARPRGEL